MAGKKTTKRTPKAKSQTRTKITRSKAKKVDYYPNRGPFYVAVLAASVLALVSVIVGMNL